MYIPKQLITQRFYVAEREAYAFSSWTTLDDALACIERFREYAPYDFVKIKGVVKVTKDGREWITSDKLANLLES